MKKITTVCGDISPDDLGATSMHEHTLYDNSLMFRRMMASSNNYLGKSDIVDLKPENFDYIRNGNYFREEFNKDLDFDAVEFEVNAFKKCGGQSIVDGDAIGMRANVADYRRLSEATGVNIVCGTGFFLYSTWPDNIYGLTEEERASIIIKEATQGIDGTNIKPGHIKCGLGAPMPENERAEELTNLAACARAAAETGLPISLHCFITVSPEDIVKAVDMILNKYGVKPDKLLVLHQCYYSMYALPLEDYVKKLDVSRNINTDCSERILDMGVNIDYDTWGVGFPTPIFVMPDDLDRLKALYQLIQKGYASQITLGHDFTSHQIQGVAHGGSGMVRIFTYAIPSLKRFGISDDIIETMTIKNPIKILSH